jgi:hypothetical protein
MPQEPFVGTKDFLFDAAELLASKGYDFVILVKHPGSEALSYTGNIRDVKTAEEVTDCLIGCFADRFPEDIQDGEDEDDEESV